MDTSNVLFTIAGQAEFDDLHHGVTFAHRKLKVDIRIAEKQEGGGYLSRESSTHACTVISSAAGYLRLTTIRSHGR